MEVARFTGEAVSFDVDTRKIPEDQIVALWRHVQLEHGLNPGDNGFSTLLRDHHAAIVGGYRYVSALVARHLPDP